MIETSTRDTGLFNVISKVLWTASYLILPAMVVTASGVAQDAYELAPVEYSKRTPQDAVSKLEKALAEGKITFKYGKRHGYLESLLQALDISPESQLLVYSKTSLQLHRISPRTPRAIYFNDDVYVGYIPGSDRLEISTADPQLGGVFYTLKQEADLAPRFVRDQGNCLSCHATSRTQSVPGHLMRSVYTSPNGQPHYGMGTHLTTHESPFEERYGGWYATGTQGNTEHLANLIISEPNEKVDRAAGANLTSLKDRIRTDRYLSSHSDWVAMLVLAHQAEMHNLITHVNFQTRQALYQCKSMNKALERPPEFISESTQNRINRSVEKMLQYMLFLNEQPIESEMAGTSDFRKSFEAIGPFDKKGRSLRQFDLKKRTFQHRCSYLIYSDSFQQLPALAKDRAYRRLFEILSGKDKTPEYASLTSAERSNLLQILRETLPDLPDYWN